MSEIEQNLRKEIDTWLPKAKKEFDKVKNCKDKDFLNNIEAYIKDTEYFLSKQDLIKSFEAVVWAWAWLEIGQQKGILK